jgi:glycyl-tRNA synthetase beta chain
VGRVTDFLLELRSEEIPARMQEKAQADLARLFAAELEKAGLAASAIETFATPRRLALIARDLPSFTAAVSEETKGPRTSAPPQALEGFLRKVGVEQHQLTERDGTWFAVVEKPGRATANVLAEAIPTIVRAFPWPKSMRWGDASVTTSALRWVRPLQGIVALLGEQVVPLEIEGVVSSAATVGHRFHHPGIITIGSAHDYAEKLRLCHVIVDPAERRRIIEEGAAALAAANGLSVIPDPALIAENAGLTEWPVPLLGYFDADFLEVPREVIQLTLRTNQKYFVLNDAEGRLAPAFICTANIDAADGGAQIVAGNGKVLAARLSDARFFWEQDLKTRLEEQAKKLSGIVFHEKLGTLADKVERVAKLARWLVEEGIVTDPANPAPSTVIPAKAGIHPTPGSGSDDDVDPRLCGDDGQGQDTTSLADMAEQAAQLCKADLVTGMVGEFPELQGVMGGYYARAEGLPDAVADAIRDHYKPVGQGDDVPTAPVTVAVSLADKLDTLASFFFADMPPSGSKDPFALRRAALGVLGLLSENRLRVGLTRPLGRIVSSHVATTITSEDQRVSDEYSVLLSAKEAGEDWDTIDVGARVSEMRHSQSAIRRDFVEPVLRVRGAILPFFADRLKVQQREAGVRHDLIDAVFALGGEDDLVRLLARVKALQAFVETEDGRNLLAGYKRAANILRKEGWQEAGSADANPLAVIPAQAGIHSSTGSGANGDVDSRLRGNDGMGLAPALSDNTALSYTPEKAEADLLAALSQAEARTASAVAAEEFESAMSALATLRAPIDAFFEGVIVNDADPAKRAARLSLLARIRSACHRVADFSRIEG